MRQACFFTLLHLLRRWNLTAHKHRNFIDSKYNFYLYAQCFTYKII
ncbi:hypothetical protein HMPREF9555_00599 [Selenomonas artemidis F0399]|uniref:Uncharacterized protein n=1 Tax=Selenomonas artemidis F0399 TaxID=749551 RepID=E7N0U8_9FIRM|nr:hypothetical protein HMPREF9555_00599 [Selenomonas artemidis F0399]